MFLVRAGWAGCRKPPPPAFQSPAPPGSPVRPPSPLTPYRCANPQRIHVTRAITFVPPSSSPELNAREPLQRLHLEYALKTSGAVATRAVIGHHQRVYFGIAAASIGQLGVPAARTQHRDAPQADYDLGQHAGSPVCPVASVATGRMRVHTLLMSRPQPVDLVCIAMFGWSARRGRNPLLPCSRR